MDNVTELKKGRQIRQATEVGKTGLKWSAGYVYEEFLTSLRGSAGIKTYQEMKENDPIVGAFMFAITQILREARWDVKGESTQEVDFLRDCMYGMVQPWSDFIANVMSMFAFGWAWFEQVYVRRPDGRIGWKKFAPRLQHSLDHWEFDDVGEVQGMWQRPAPDYSLIYLPLSKSLHFKTEPASSNPEGRSILRNAFQPWFYKKHIQEIEGIGLERDLTGMPVIHLPEGVSLEDDDAKTKEVIAAAKAILQNVRRDEQDGLLLPAGWGFELVASPGQRQFDTVSVINRYNKEIAVTVLAQFIMLGMERTGSYALAEEQTDMFYLCLEGWMDSIAMTINRQAIPLLLALNGVKDTKKMPYVVHTPVRRFQLKDIANYVAKLADDRVNALTIENETRDFLLKYARLSEFAERRK